MSIRSKNMKETQSILRACLTALLVGIAMTCLLAQEVPSSPYLTVPQRCAFLVANPFVAKQLLLTPDQVKAAQKALSKYSAVSNKLVSLKKPVGKEMAANDVWLANSYLNILTPTQKGVILQLGIQQLGSEALLDPTIIVKVGLSPVQAHKIAAIYKAVEKRSEDVDAMEGDAVVAIPLPKPGANQKAYEKKKSAVYAKFAGERARIQREKLDADKEILGVMTPNQQETWLGLSAAPAKTPSAPPKKGK